MAVTRNHEFKVGPYTVHVTLDLTVDESAELQSILDDVAACVHTALAERSRALPIEVHGKVRSSAGEVVGRWFGQR